MSLVFFFFVCVCVCPGELLSVQNSFKNTVVGFFIWRPGELLFVWNSFKNTVFFWVFFFFGLWFFKRVLPDIQGTGNPVYCRCQIYLTCHVFNKKIFFNQPDGYFVLRAVLQISSLSFYQR